MKEEEGGLRGTAIHLDTTLHRRDGEYGRRWHGAGRRRVARGGARAVLGETEMEESVNFWQRAPRPGMFTRTSASTNGGVPRPSWPCPELVLSEGTRYVDHILCIVHYPIYNRRSDSVSGRIRVALIFLSSPFLSLLFSPTTVPRGTPLPASLVFSRSQSLSFSPSQPPPTSPVFRALSSATHPLKEPPKSAKHTVVRRRPSAECG